MKTKFMYVGLAAMMLAGLNSCSNDDKTEVDNGGETKSVRIKIGDSEAANRAVTAPIGSGTAATFTTGDMYFVNAAGVILEHYTITSAATSNTAPKNLDMAVVTSATGETAIDLPGSVSAVHVVGNSTTGAVVLGTTNISAILSPKVAVTAQTLLTGPNLYGNGTLVLNTPAVPGVSNALFDCAVDLVPTVSRLELTDIVSKNDIDGFEVEGIFVDNYYSQAAIGGAVVSSDLKFTGPVDTEFDNNTTNYPTAISGYIYDWYTAPLVSNASLTVAAPVAGNVWGYSLFADGTGAVPRIIIRLKNISTISGTTYSDPQFITVKGIAVSGTALTTIQAGKVYNIGAGDLVFDETNLSSIPNLDLIDIIVKVKVLDWDIIPITPILI